MGWQRFQVYVHIVFDNYTYEYSVPTKDWSTGVPRIIANINQELPNNSEWVEFLGNSNNKSQLIDLLVNYLLEEYEMDKDIFVNNHHKTYLKAKSWKTFKVTDEPYIHSIKRLINNFSPDSISK